MSNAKLISTRRGGILSEFTEQPRPCDLVECRDGRVCLEFLDPVLRCHQTFVCEGLKIELGEKIRTRGHLLRVEVDERFGRGPKWDAIVQQIGSVAVQGGHNPFGDVGIVDIAVPEHGELSAMPEQSGGDVVTDRWINPMPGGARAYEVVTAIR